MPRPDTDRNTVIPLLPCFSQVRGAEAEWLEMAVEQRLILIFHAVVQNYGIPQR